MELQSLVQQILTAPTPAVLWELYGRLLAADADPPLLQMVEVFHHYLHDLQSKAEAQQFSELASLLDIGAVGGVAVQNLVGGEAHGEGADDLIKRFLLGTVSESLMVIASRQYVKGWQSELHSVHSQATWYLARELWSLSAEMQEDLPAEERWAHIDRLLAPARDPESPNEMKAVFLGRLFQILLLRRLAPLLS
jgi:hypothetical protein